MPTGTVKWFNTTKGYGFIAPESGGSDIFVHISAVEQSGLTGLADDQKVSFEMSEGRDGRQMATELELLERFEVKGRTVSRVVGSAQGKVEAGAVGQVTHFRQLRLCGEKVGKISAVMHHERRGRRVRTDVGRGQPVEILRA